MKRNELILLRELMNKELERRKRINKMLDMEESKEYSTYLDKKLLKLELDELSILKKVLTHDLKVTKTNGIYVCTCAFKVECSICYEDTEYYSEYVDINSPKAEFKRYVDIESGDDVVGTNKEDNEEKNRIYFKDFETNNIVLNPHNSSVGSNGYYEVRNEFFINSIKYGQAKSKKLILEKYPRL